MKKMLRALTVAILAVGMAGCISTDEPEPPPAKPLEKKVDDLNRKVEELQALLAELKESRKGTACPQTTELTRCKASSIESDLSDQGKPPTKTAQNKGIVVNNRGLRLSYSLEDVGKSNVKSIQVWATQDAMVWNKIAEEAPNGTNSIQLQAASEGRWGFKLLAKSGVGRGEPQPVKGTQPDFWVQVDETKPKVTIQAVEVSGGPQNGQMSLRWTVEDLHLAERPISLFYSPEGQQWTAMANGLANDGRWVWSIPPDLAHHSYYIKVEAVDQAGNIGAAQTATPVVTDLSIPKARFKAVEVSQPGSFISASNPGFGSASPIVPVTAIEPAPPSPAAPTPPPEPRPAMPFPVPSPPS